MTKKPIFLVSSIGGMLAQNVALCIRDAFPNAFIVGMDIHTQHAGTFFSDSFVLIENANSHSYLESLKKIVNETSPDFFLPLNELELNRLKDVPQNELDTILGKSSIIWSGTQCLKLFLDKRTTVEFLMDLGLNTPKTYNLTELEICQYPIVVKPTRGSGSKSFFKVKNRTELDAALALVNNPIIQQYIPSSDSEYTAGVFARRGVEPNVVVFRRILSPGGGTSWCESIYDEGITSICKVIAKKIDLNGSINVQLRKFNGKAYIFEINPRFSSTVHIRSQLGFKDLLWSIDSKSDYSSFDAAATSNRTFAVFQSSRAIG